MNVLMEVLLKVPQPIVEGMKGRAGFFWGCEVRAETANVCQQRSRSVMLLRHHCDRIGDCPEATPWSGRAKSHGLLEAGHIRKQDPSFLRQVLREFFVQLNERCSDDRQLGHR